MHAFLERIRETLTDSRFVANVTVTYGIIVVLVLLALILRRLLGHGGERLAQWTGLRWLEHVGREAAHRARRIVARLTWAAVFLLTAAGITYHFLGRDIRFDVRAWYARITAEQWLDFGLRALGVAALVVGAWIGIRIVRRLCAALQTRVIARIGEAVQPEGIARWFTLLQRFGSVAICLTALWGAGQVTNLARPADLVVGFILRVLTILVVARLLTLGARAASRVGIYAGDHYLAQGKFKNYWARVKLLFPFGERCFEAAVYILAASMCLWEFSFIRDDARYGPKLVHCIAIFFVTRVLIELAYVLLHEAFGLYTHGRVQNQKERTLVPLLHSTCQYVLYFGAGIVMLRALEVDTTPILAGAGILGLGVGLGAQSLVTDVVSGFFILFESQYLVGDYVQIGDAAGVVEAVGIRVTQIRDARGKLYLIPNGQIKGVVNYSKGYINAVVDVKVPIGSDVETTLRMMADAGRRLKDHHEEVLAETEIQGIIELGTAEMTVRAVTRVQPGAHDAMENAYRRMLKAVMDEAHSPGAVKLAA